MSPKEPKGFDNHEYLYSMERLSITSINTQLKILKGIYRKSKFYKGIQKNHLNYEISYLEYLKFWHESI